MAEGSAALTPEERRALSAGTAAAGGTLVAAEQFVAELIKTLDDTVVIRNLATKIALTESDTLAAPTLDTDIEDGTWTTEVASIDEDTAMGTGTRAMVPNWLAKRIKVSDRLLRVSAIGVEQLVRDRLSYKLGIAQEKGFLTGSGSGQPLGVFTVSASGISSARNVVVGSTTAITADPLIDAKYALKGQYWQRPSTRWLIHRDGVKQISKLKDSQGQYLWEVSRQLGQPDMLLGIGVVMSEFVPNTFTTGQPVLMLGDFSFYWIVDSLAIQIKRLDELYAETNQVGFIGRMELDGAPVREEPFVRGVLA
jgi:HK97 family phage major capsid protein